MLFLFYWKIVEYTLYVFWSQEGIQRVMDIVKFIFWLCSAYSKNFYDVRNLNYLKLNTYGWKKNHEKRFEDIRILQRMRINHRQCWRPNINKCFWKTAQTNPVPPWYKHSSYLERGEECSMFGIRDEISSGEWYWGNDETREIRWEWSEMEKARD